MGAPPDLDQGSRQALVASGVVIGFHRSLWRWGNVRRRGLVTLLGGSIAVHGGPRQVARAQGQQLRRVGILAPGPLTPIDRLKDRLREHGWVDGKNHPVRGTMGT